MALLKRREESPRSFIIGPHLTVRIGGDCRPAPGEVWLDESAWKTLSMYAVAESRAVQDLAQALHRTVEHVGPEVLPNLPGWPHFDALAKYAPDIAAEHIGKPAEVAPDPEPEDGPVTEKNNPRLFAVVRQVVAEVLAEHRASEPEPFDPHSDSRLAGTGRPGFDDSIAGPARVDVDQGRLGWLWTCTCGSGSGGAILTKAGANLDALTHLHAIHETTLGAP